MTTSSRVLLALFIGCAVGIAVMVAVNVPVEHYGNWPDHARDYFGFWGVVFGSFAGLFAFGMTLALLRREVIPRRSAHRHPLAWSAGIAAVVGVIVMSAINIPVYNSGQWPDHGREILGLWGAFGGLLTAVATFVGIRSRLGAGDAPVETTEATGSKIGLLVAAIVAGVFGLLVVNWNVVWGVDLTSLEGAWLWPLGIVPLVLSFALFRGYLKARRARRIVSQQTRDPGL